MFKFLKEKLGKAISTFTKKAEESSIDSGIEEDDSVPKVGEVSDKGVPVLGDDGVSDEGELAPLDAEVVPKEDDFLDEDAVLGVDGVSDEGMVSEEFPVDGVVKRDERGGVDHADRSLQEEKEGILADKGVSDRKKDPAAGIKRLKAQKEAQRVDISKERDQEKELPEKEFQEKELPEKELQEKELPEKELQEKELPEKELHEKEPLPKKGFFRRLQEKVTTAQLSEERFEELFWDIEMILLENNVAVEVIDRIKEDLFGSLVGKAIPRGKMADRIAETLRASIKDILKQDTFDFFERIREKKPYVVCFIGINGSGKTTTIAKIAKQLKDKGMQVVLAASDTFRAAAIDQLAIHAEKSGAKIIKHDYGSDAAAVAFDAVEHARSKGKDVVLIDTAGRMHSNANLMDELKKVVRVAKPDLLIFVGESITGNDCVEQAKQFDAAVGLDGIILTKADIDDKGGAALSISYVTKKPIVLIGMGQGYDDLVQFSPELILRSLGI